MARVNVNPLSCMATSRAAAVVVMLLLLCSAGSACNAHLSSTFYAHSCPKALKIIRSVVKTAIAQERRMAASLIRLHFHDCFVQGCDGSILLDNSSTISSEKFAPPNKNSVRGYEVIEKAKSAVEKACPGVVSCADILAIAARDSSVDVGGPSWKVKLGRRDSTTANATLAVHELPAPTDSLQTLISVFRRKGFTTRDLVALSGSHTIGQARCTTIHDRIYNGTDIDAGFARKRRHSCLATATDGDQNLAPLDLVTPNSFDNNYFKNILQKKGLLQSDQVLYSGQSTDTIVLEYSKNPDIFKCDFATAMIKMGDIELLTGSVGVIRRVCNRVD